MCSTILTRQDTQRLRGLAIFLILVHNFCHIIPGFIPENEHLWSIEPILQYGQYVLHGGPHLILNLFSHFGFYGIAVFIFLSGYGLASKYDKVARLSFVAYLVKHARKLWRLLFVGILIYYIAFRFLGGAAPSWDQIIKQALFLTTLLPVRPLIFGPWWWLSLIMQFYVVYYFFYHNRSLRSIGVFTFFCLLLQFGVIFYCRHNLADEQSLLVYLYYNFPTLALPFSMGVYASRCGAPWLHSPWLFLASLVLVVLGSFNVLMWSLGSVFACIALVQMGQFFGQVKGLGIILSWLGKVSAWAFVVHPIVRRYVFRLNATHSVYFTLALYLVICLLLSFILYTITSYIDRKLQNH